MFTTLGFFSVVAHTDAPDTILIRSRTRADIEALRIHHLPDLEILESAGTDYRWRALVSRDEWEHAAGRMAADIDYPNFKAAVAKRQGKDRARRYTQVWEVMHALQRDEA